MIAKQLKLGLIIAISSLMLTTWANQGDKKVLIIGIDGLRGDALKQHIDINPHSALAHLATTGATAWNVYADHQHTESGPGWASNFTGVDVKKHGVESNWGMILQYNKEYQPFYGYLDEQYSSTTISTWPVLNIWLSLSGINIFQHKQDFSPYFEPSYNRDKKAFEILYGLLNQNKEIDDIFAIHLDTMDNFGHSRQFSDKHINLNVPDTNDMPGEYETSHAKKIYQQLLEPNTDYVSLLNKELNNYIGTLIKTIEKRTAEHQEQWLILVTSDHGGVFNVHDYNSSIIEEKKSALEKFYHRYQYVLAMDKPLICKKHQTSQNTTDDNCTIKDAIRNVAVIATTIGGKAVTIDNQETTYPLGLIPRTIFNYLDQQAPKHWQKTPFRFAK